MEWASPCTASRCRASPCRASPCSPRRASRCRAKQCRVRLSAGLQRGSWGPWLAVVCYDGRRKYCTFDWLHEQACQAVLIPAPARLPTPTAVIFPKVGTFHDDYFQLFMPKLTEPAEELLCRWEWGARAPMPSLRDPERPGASGSHDLMRAAC